MKSDRKSEDLPLIIFVTTNKDPYNLHIPPMLSVPTGLAYKSRYRKRWIDFEYKNKEQLIGRKGVYVLILGEDFFLPFRLFEIKDVYDYGDILFFEVIFGKLIKFNNSDFSEYSQLIKSRIYKNKKFKEVEKLVFDSDIDISEFNIDSEDDKKITRDIWTDTVLKLGEYSPFKNIAFLKFNLFKKGQLYKKIKPRKIYEGLVGYKLAPGKEYHFDFFEYAGGIKEKESIPNPFSLNMSVDTNFISTVKDEEHIDGAYDRFSLFFQTNDIIWKEYTFLNINDNQKINSVKMPSIYIPILIEKKWYILILFILLFLIGFLGFLIPHSIQELLGIGLEHNTIQAIGVILIFFVLTGGSLKRTISLIRSKIKL